MISPDQLSFKRRQRQGDTAMAKPARLLILERARALIEDERHWCLGDLARDARGFSVSPTDSNAEQRCAVGAILAAAYQFTGDLDRAKEVAMVAMRPVHEVMLMAVRLQVPG